MASPNAGQKLPPSLRSATPGCGSYASCHESPPNDETIPLICRVRVSPQLVEFDWPAPTNTSPTPNFSIFAFATTLPPCMASTSSEYHPPAGTATSPAKLRVAGVKEIVCHLPDNAPSSESPVAL